MLQILNYFIIGNLFVFGCLFCLGQNNSASVNDDVILTGTVMDRAGAIDPGVRVNFRNSIDTVQSNADKDGHFRVSLRPDVYEIEIFRGKAKMNYRRSKIALSKSFGGALNIVILPECVSYGCDGPGYDFTTVSGGWLKEPRTKMIIAYNKVKTLKFAKTYSDSVLTYGFYTIAADSIQLKGDELVATNGWIEDGYIRRTFTKLNVSLDDGPLSITQTWVQSKELRP